MMLPASKTTLGSHCFRYAAMAAGEFYFSGNAEDAFGLVTPAAVVAPSVGEDGSTIAANAWTEAHIGIAADTRVGRDLFVETCVSGSSFLDSSSFRTYLNNVFDLGLAMMLPTVKSDLGRHCFSYGYILSKEFYGDEPLDVLDLNYDVDLDALWGTVAKDADGRVTASAFKAAMHAKLDPEHRDEEVAALDTYLDKVFTTSLSMMLPASKTTLGSHCTRYAAMAAGEFYFSGNAEDAFGLVTPAVVVPSVDGSTIAANAWTSAHVGIAADTRVGRDLFVETCVSGSSFPDSSSFRTYLNNVFDLGLAMMLPTVKSDLGQHCFSYGYILSKEFYGDEPLDVMDFKSNDDL